MFVDASVSSCDNVKVANCTEYLIDNPGMVQRKSQLRS